MVIIGLRLEGRRDASTAARSATSTQHALVYRILVVVLTIIVELMLYDEIVLFFLNLHSMFSLFVRQLTNRLSTFLAYLSYFLVRDEGDCAEFVSGDHFGRVGRIILSDGSTKDHLTAVILICSQV